MRTKPKGILIPIGGNEDKVGDTGGNDINPRLDFFEEGILSTVLGEMKDEKSHIEVITTATNHPKELWHAYEDAFHKLGCRKVTHMDIRSRNDANNPEILKKLKSADGIMFTGGDQLKISMAIGGTKFQKLLQQRYMREKFLIAGTSAGAMAMSGGMIYEGNSQDALLKNNIKMTTGLGLLPHVIIDTHFMNRGRFGRLAQAVVSNPGNLGIGIGEDTAMVIREGTKMQVVGSGMVVIFDAENIGYCDFAVQSEGSPVSIENLKVHFIAHSNGYDLEKRKFIV